MSVIELIYFIDCDFNIPANKEAGKIDAKARDQVAHLETVTNYYTSSRQENVTFCTMAANFF